MKRDSGSLKQKINLESINDDRWHMAYVNENSVDVGFGRLVNCEGRQSDD